LDHIDLKILTTEINLEDLGQLFPSGINLKYAVKQLIREHLVQLKTFLAIFAPVSGQETKDLQALSPMTEHGIDTEEHLSLNLPPTRCSLLSKNILHENYRSFYKKLDPIPCRHVHPLPLMDNPRDALGQTLFFGTMDLLAGYWQLKLKKSSRCNNSVLTPEGVFEWTRMSLGLMFVRFKWKCMLVNLDDVVVYSSIFENHLIDLSFAITQLLSHNFHLKAKKCIFRDLQVLYC
jgi:hypothetical protein